MGLYLAGATTQLDLRNNIIINKAVSTGTGGTVALYRGESGITYYDAASNNNTSFTFHNIGYNDQTCSEPPMSQTTIGKYST